MKIDITKIDPTFTKEELEIFIGKMKTLPSLLRLREEYIKRNFSERETRFWAKTMDYIIRVSLVEESNKFNKKLNFG